MMSKTAHYDDSQESMTLEPSLSRSRSSSPPPRLPSVPRAVDGETDGSERDSAGQQVCSITKSNKFSTTTTTAEDNNKQGKQQIISQRPLPTVVARRAFECVVDARGVVSQGVYLTKEEYSRRYGDRGIEAISAVGRSGRPLRPTHDQPSSATYSLEPLQFGAEFDLGDPQGFYEGAWGVDLHWCDLAALVGFPAEGESPWGANDKHIKNEDGGDVSSWRCVFLDVSLNHLKGIDVVTDQPGLHDVAVLDISNNLIDDLDGVQDLANLQILVASNNELESTEALGELPADARLHHVDLCHNAISTFETPRLKNAFRSIKTLRLASNRLQLFEEDAALAMPLLERLDVSDNELVSIDWVAFLPALIFLDCSRNRLSVISTFTSALAGPPRLTEVIAEGNKVTSDPQYRITVLIKCKKVRRLDYRPVDGAALMRQYDRVLESKALTDVQETASREYYLRVENERARLEQRKAILKTQEKQLNDAFQEYRLQRQREMEECVALAVSLRRQGGDAEANRGQLTPNVVRLFQEAVEQQRASSITIPVNRPTPLSAVPLHASEPEHDKVNGHDENDDPRENDISAVLRSVVRRGNKKRLSGTIPTINDNASNEVGSRSCCNGGSRSDGDESSPRSYCSRHERDGDDSVESRSRSTARTSSRSRSRSSSGSCGPEEKHGRSRERRRKSQRRDHHPTGGGKGNKPKKDRSVPTPWVGNTTSTTTNVDATAVDRPERGDSRVSSVAAKQETKPPPSNDGETGVISEVAVGKEKKQASGPSSLEEALLIPGTKNRPTGLRRVFGTIGMLKKHGKSKRRPR